MRSSQRSLRAWLILCMCALAWEGVATFGVRADDSKPNKSGKPTKPTDPKPKSTSQDRDKEDVSTRESAAVEFARRHHPELAALLEQLKTSVPQEYQAAIADLDRSRQRLERSHERTPEQYDLELADWKVNSRIRLLVARLTMGADDSLKEELRAAVKERHEIRTQRLAAEQQRLRQRLEKITEQLAQQDTVGDEQIERELTSLLNSTSATSSKATRNAAASKETKGSGDEKPSPSRAATKSPKAGSGEKSPSKPEDKTRSKPTARPKDAPKSGGKP